MGRHNFELSRLKREEQLKPEFLERANRLFKTLSLQLGQEDEPDYRVMKEEEVVAFLEAEFLEQYRWPQQGFRYPTVRWPERKRVYCQDPQPGFYRGRPVFLISIRYDLEDAVYIDAQTWCRKATLEVIRRRGERYWGLPKDDPDLQWGLGSLEDYLLRSLEKA